MPKHGLESFPVTVKLITQFKGTVAVDFGRALDFIRRLPNPLARAEAHRTLSELVGDTGRPITVGIVTIQRIIDFCDLYSIPCDAPVEN
ncbi:MAG TPA: hypothetical protein VJ246_03615 [Patescibacteria group bacterium]|nr:hypothetical protein [Patescibacteria group bacterium]